MKKHITVPAVWAAIRATHPEMIVFGSYSYPNGYYDSDQQECSMYTEYGFKGDDCPIIAAETTWLEGSDEKTNMYWLCSGGEEDLL